MASWKKLLVSGSDIQVGAITSTGTLSIPGFSDVSASLAGALAGGDNLGNHTATQDINLNGNSLTNILNASASGFISASEFIGDGSKLTGISSTLDIAGTSGTDSVDLTTDTLTFSGSNGITAVVTDNKVEIVPPQDLRTTATPSFAGLDINGTADISGNVTLSGNSQTVIHSGTGNLTISSTSGKVVVDGVTMAGGTVTGTIISGSSLRSSGNLQVNTNGSIGGNLTVTGDLTVNGTTTTIDTTNLLVEDRYILLNSGASDPFDSGIIFGGTNSAANSGSALVWDADYKDEGRLAVVNDLASNASTDTTPDYYVAGVYIGDEGGAATAQADHIGNIRVDGTEIFIYV